MIELENRPGQKVFIRIPWNAYTTVTPGIVVCRTPTADLNADSAGPWEVVHAATGATMVYCDDDEQAQAIAADLGPVADWPKWMDLPRPEKARLGKVAMALAEARGARRSFGDPLGSKADAGGGERSR